MTGVMDAVPSTRTRKIVGVTLSAQVTTITAVLSLLQYDKEVTTALTAVNTLETMISQIEQLDFYNEDVALKKVE
eukprot:5146446-Pyramimonas_sp.AAC.2